MADVAAELHALEADALDHLVGAGARDAQRIAERADAHDATTVGEERIAFKPGARVEHAAIVRRRRQTVDPIALLRLVGIAGGGEHYAERAAAGPFGFRPGPAARA